MFERDIQFWNGDFFTSRRVINLRFLEIRFSSGFKISSVRFAKVSLTCWRNFIRKQTDKNLDSNSNNRRNLYVENQYRRNSQHIMFYVLCFHIKHILDLWAESMDARVQIIILSTEISKRKKKGTLNHAFCLKKEKKCYKIRTAYEKKHISGRSWYALSKIRVICSDFILWCSRRV